MAVCQVNCDIRKLVAYLHPALYVADHMYREGVVLHWQDVQDWRSARRRGDDGLDGPRTGKRNHHHLCSYHMHLEQALDQHHRYSWSRGLHPGGMPFLLFMLSADAPKGAGASSDTGRPE